MSEVIPLIVKSSRTRCFFVMFVAVVGASSGVGLVAGLGRGPLLVGCGVVLACC